MRKIDPSHYSSAQTRSRIKPEVVNLGELPPIELPSANEFVVNEPSERVNARTPEQVNTRTGERPNTRTSAHLNERADEQVNASPPSTHRVIKRCSFNLYADQMRALSRIAFETEQDKSELVRAMLDAYLKANG